MHVVILAFTKENFTFKHETFELDLEFQHMALLDLSYKILEFRHMATPLPEVWRLFLAREKRLRVTVKDPKDLFYFS